MKPLMKKCILLIVVLLSICTYLPSIVNADSIDTKRIDEYIENQKNISKIPGISLVVVEKGETVYQKSFGYADVKSNTSVTSNTLFEIGSTTKAFTALAILQLEEQGLLHRSDDVQKYIPWLEVKYNNEPKTITLEQLLHHTSGIPSNSITHIPESSADNALELTVRTLLNQQLNREPGSSFEYATINYDVLGLIIEIVAKQPYDRYIKQHILEPIGMNNSFVGSHQVNSTEMATGYKIGFMKEQPYLPPIYKGNIPAGYIVSNANDIAIWMKLLLGESAEHANGALDNELIQKAFIPDKSVAPFDKDTYYANGWAVLNKNDKTYISHAGENPTFTSYIILQPEKQIGVAILANMNTSFTTAIGRGVMEIWEGNEVKEHHSDSYQMLDRYLTIIILIIGCLAVLFILVSVRLVRQLVKKQRMRTSLSVKRLVLLSLHTLIVAAVVTLIILSPNYLLGLPWSFIEVWAPTTIPVFFYSFIAVTIINYFFGLLLIGTRKLTKSSK